jgi:brefeldin A-resistance guanine nucleotide exchange factor 1
MQHEAIPESLKNVVLVMNATGVLVPPSPNDTRSDRQQALWAASQERIERFLPGFLEAVIAAPLPPSIATAPVPEPAHDS